MSKHETEMTLWAWEQIGGTLYEEFHVVRKGPGHSQRHLDGLIVTSLPTRRASKGERVDLEGHDVVVIQTKNERLGMYLMGQTLFSIDLVKRHKPKSVRSIALCALDDALLRPLMERHEGCEVWICPEEISGKSRAENERARQRRRRT